MKTLPRALTTVSVLTGMLAMSASSASAELVLPKPSPKAEVSQRVGVTDISVSYSSPAVKERKIWGELVPFDTVWRTGANECTKISVSTDVKIADQAVEAGSYCLFTVPGEDSWKLALSKNTELWGASDYSEKEELFRVDLKPITVEKSERMNFSFVDFDDSSATLLLQWDTVGLPIPISINTESLAVANIEKLEDAEWREYADAAQYLNSIKRHDQALKLVEKSIEAKETWYNTWLKASILAASGEKSEAVSLAKKAKEMGDKSNFFAFYEPQISKAISDWQ